MRTYFSIDAFAERLSSLCRERGMDVDELSRRTGFDSQELRSFARGEAIPSAGEAYRLACALDCSIDVLLGRVELALVA